MRDPEGIAQALRSAGSVAICSHISPDGDTIGSALAMRLILRQMGKTAEVFCQDKVPDNLLFLPGVEWIRNPDGCGERFDLMLSVDVSDPARLGSCAELRKLCGRTAQIDHHGSNPLFMETNSVDGTAAATCVMIREQMEYLGVALSPEIAVCLYTGISTDTGNFSFSCTNAEAFRVTEELMKTDLPVASLSRKLFREKSRPQLRLLGRAIERMTFRGPRDEIAVMKLTLRDFEDCGATGEHSDTLVNYGLETTGTRMALLGRETEEGDIKISLRAVEPLRVDEIAVRLGGGGHAQAAGITMEGSLEETVNRVVEELIRNLEQI